MRPQLVSHLGAKLTSFLCLIALYIQQAERQRTTPQAKPPRTTSRCGCSLGAAARSAARQLILEYGRMMRRLMENAECW